MKPTQLTQPSIAAGDRALIAVLAACTTFVIGYTTVRVSMAQNQELNNSGTTVQQTVIPHEATLWSGFGE